MNPADHAAARSEHANDHKKRTRETSQLGARIDKQVKEEFEDFCDSNGYKMNALLERYIREGLARDRKRAGGG